jgi:hypothetical protein
MKTSTVVLIGVGVLAVGGVIYFVHRQATSPAAAAKKAAGTSGSILGSLGTTILSSVPALVKGVEGYFSSPSSSSAVDTSITTDADTGDVGFDGGWVGN